jgi:hypothetical protein
MTDDRDGGLDGGSGGAARLDVVDDQTFDLLQALTSKLEAIDAYREYSAHDDSGLFLQLLSDELRHAELLLAALRIRID